MKNTYYEELVAKQQSFTDELKADYPSLFHKNASGDLENPPCGICCPDPWKPIVRVLCEGISRYGEGYSFVPTKNPWSKFKSKLYSKLLVPIHNFLWRAFDPKCPDNRKIMTMDEVKALKIKHPYRIAMRDFVQSVGRKLRPNDGYERKDHPKAKIAQVKSKFDNLCFYIDNGDPKIYGMIALAELMASKIPRK